MQQERSLALLSRLSRIQFADGKTVSEQLPQFEALILEYERISGQRYSDDAKVAAVLLACPSQIRQHLHMWLANTTTYEQLKDRIIQLEAVTTKWDSANSLMLPTRVTGDDYAPMEVDYIGKSKGKKGGKAKGKDTKGKEKGKDKGKKDGKGSWKGHDKGKSMWEKGPGKKGKNSDKGSKGGKQSNACHLCGKVGHFARECWKRVNQIEDNANINAGGANSSSTGQAGPGQTSSTGHRTSVKMVRLETPPDVNALEIFDLTTPRGESEIQHPWRVGMVELVENEVFYDVEEHHEFEDAYMECFEPAVQVPENVAIVAMDLQDEEDVMAPYPLTEAVINQTDWSEDEREELEELERREMFHDVEKMVVAEKKDEVELDEVTYSEKTTVKELQLACKERQLAQEARRNC